jgi:hypothetical protein
MVGRRVGADEQDDIGLRHVFRTGLDTAPEPTALEQRGDRDAWHSRVQWSTLLVPKPVRTSFWNR